MSLKTMSLGSGRYGTVRRVDRDGRQLARKTFTNPAHFQRELDAFQATPQWDPQGGLHCHPNLVCAVAAAESKDGLYTIDMTVVPGQELTTFLHRHYFKDWKKWILMSYQLVEAVAFLHSHGVVHRDIKSNNIMWDPNTQHLTLVDLGLACCLWCPNRHWCQSEVGTRGFMAPELEALLSRPAVANNGIDLRAADMYSLGITLLDSLGSQVMDQTEFVTQDYSTRRNVFQTELRAAKVPIEILTLITSLIEITPKNRPTSQKTQETFQHILHQYKIQPLRFPTEADLSKEDADNYVNQYPFCHPHLPCREGTKISRQPGRALQLHLADPKFVFYSLLEAVRWLHDHGRAHHDLVLDHIFWDPETSRLQLLPVPVEHDLCTKECFDADLDALILLKNKEPFELTAVPLNSLDECISTLSFMDS